MSQSWLPRFVPVLDGLGVEAGMEGRIYGTWKMVGNKKGRAVKPCLAIVCQGSVDLALIIF